MSSVSAAITPGAPLTANQDIDLPGHTQTIEIAKTNDPYLNLGVSEILFPLPSRPVTAFGTPEWKSIMAFINKKHTSNFSQPQCSLMEVESLTSVSDIQNQVKALQSAHTSIGLGTNIFYCASPAQPDRRAPGYLANSELVKDTTSGALHYSDLFTNYGDVSISQVASSTHWWKAYGKYKKKDCSTSPPAETEHGFDQEMILSYAIIVNHMGDQLKDSCLRSYNTFPIEQRGGPLLFKIMMDQLMSGSETALAALVATVKKYNIATDAADGARQAIKVLTAASSAAAAMRPVGSGVDPYPSGWVETNIKVLGTTSVEEFNGSMKRLLQDAEHNRKLKVTSIVTNDEAGLRAVFEFATTTLTDLISSGQWASSTASNDKASSFTARTDAKRCFNCDKVGCHPKKCDKPLGEERIKANREKFEQEKKKKRKKNKRERPHKWRLPESHENNQRVADGKPYKFNSTKKYWEPVETPESGLPQVPPIAALTIDDKSTSEAANTAFQSDMASHLEGYSRA